MTCLAQTVRADVTHQLRNRRVPERRLMFAVMLR